MLAAFIICLLLLVVSIATGKAIPGGGDAYMAAMLVLLALGHEKKGS